MNHEHETIIFYHAISLHFYKLRKRSVNKRQLARGGEASFSSSKDNGAQSSNENLSTIQASPNIGYFFIDKFSAGLKLSLFSQKSSLLAGPSTVYGFGPFIRYYFLPIEKQLNLFAEAGDKFNIATGPYSQSRQNSNTYFFSAGPAFYFNEHVGLEFSIAFMHNKQVNIASASNTVQVGFGLQIHLQKNK
jgi:hypothetical protein